LAKSEKSKSMLITPSPRTQLLSASATLAMNALAKERHKNGLPVFNLSTDEPDYPTPDHIKLAAISAIEQGFTHYTAAGGTPELKHAIQTKFLRDNQLNYEYNEITAANGGKQILYNLFQVLLTPGDEVICPSPYWLSYKPHIELAGGKFIEALLSEKDHFTLTAEIIAQYLTPQTKVLIINSPSNPSSRIIPEAELKKIGELALKNNLIVISDDVYEFFYFTEKKPLNIINLVPELKNQTISVHSST
jgi:aspartate aminotransferase